MYHFTDGGLENIWLEDGYEIESTPYGEAVSVRNLPNLVQAVCSALVCKPGRLSGLQFRYVRQAMLMSQAALGRKLGRSDQSIAIWEKSDRVPKFADLLLRVLYAAHSNGEEKVKNLVPDDAVVERDTDLILRFSKRGWIARKAKCSDTLLCSEVSAA